MSDDKLLAEAARSPVARLATTGANGVDLVPITFVMTGSTVVTAVDHKPKTTRRLQRLDNIERDPRVTILIDHYDDDWLSLWWVRLRGIARVYDEGPRVVTAIEQLVAKYPRHYAHMPPAGPVIAVDVTEIRTWRAS